MLVWMLCRVDDGWWTGGSSDLAEDPQYAPATIPKVDHVTADRHVRGLAWVQG